MVVPIETLACYVPGLILGRFAEHPCRIGQEMERVQGAVLFSDLSGFTALTERLAREGPAGAEELSKLLNGYFSRLIEVITAHGGDVLKLAGDALIALFRSSDQEPLRNATLHAAQCGLAVQGTLGDFPASKGLRLSSKVGIGVGEVVAMHVGGIFDRWELLVAGDPLVQMGHAEHQAEPGEVLLSAKAWKRIRRFAEGTERAEGCVRLDRLQQELPLWPLLPPMPPLEAGPALLGYIPGAIRSRMAAGQAAWLSELRRITILFVNLPGLNQTGPEDLDRMQVVMRSLQTALYRFEGSVNKLSVDEKGVTLVAAMGLPPLAHEDDAARGVKAALEIRRLLDNLGRPCAIGVTTGRAYCGEIGGPRRREYTIIGDVVNLSARLMQAALLSGEPGAIYCDAETRRAVRNRLNFDELPAKKVKGKSDPVQIFRPSAGRTERLKVDRAIVGRLEERRRLVEGLEAVREGAARVIVVEGEAGIGKSRLIDDLAEQAKQRGLTSLRGSGDAIEKATAYFAWRPIFAELLGIAVIEDPDRRRRLVLERLGEDDRLARLAPLLNDVFGLELPDDATTAAMTGKVRAENTRDLLLKLLEKAAAERPCLIVLEDAHWMDSASWSLATLASRRLGSALLVVSMRPMPDSPAEHRMLLEAPDADHLQLGPMPPEDALTLACRGLGVETLPPEAVRLIREKAQGNPFFSEELAYALRDSGVIEILDGHCRTAPGVDWGAVSVPDSLQGVITDRIDRLVPAQQMTLKVASVIGRMFAYRTLNAVYPIEPERPALPGHLRVLERLDLTLLEDPEPELSYLFKHAVTQEVAYDLMLFAQRRQLHKRVARWYERTHAEDLTPHYPLLAHHWSRAEEASRAVVYLDRAGEQALRGGAALEAVGFLQEAIRLEAQASAHADGGLMDDRARLARRELLLGRAFLDLGRSAESRTHVEQSLRLLGRPLPSSRWQLATQFGRQIAIQVAHGLRPARFLGRGRGDPEELRQASVAYDVIGQLCYFSQDVATGVYAALRALNLAEGLGPSPELARSYATMCVAAGLVPIHPLAERYGRRAREVVEAVDDLAARAWVAELTGVYWLGVGRWAAGREVLTEAVRLTERLGDWRRLEESLGELGRLDYLQGRYESGDQRFIQLGEVARERGHAQAAMWCLHGRAKNLFRMGRIEEALAMLEESPATFDPSVDRADAILGLGMLALVRWRLGKPEEALHAADFAMDWIALAPPIVNYNFEGYAGAVEVYLACWEAAGPRGPAGMNLPRRALRASNALRRFARLFPIASPRTYQLSGLAQWLSGRRRRARRSWNRALVLADRLAMPFERASIHFEIGRHSNPNDPEGDRHLGEAHAIFKRLGATADVQRVEAFQKL